MANRVGESELSGEAIYQLLFKAQNDNATGRDSGAPFVVFRPVSIQMKDGRRYSALSRELSTVGVGLVHTMNLSLEEVELTITRDRGYSVRARAQIAWCRACGEGWYISGAQFLDNAADGG